MYIEELADKIAREIIDALDATPKPMAASIIIGYTFQTISKYVKEIAEACPNQEATDKLEKEIFKLFYELIWDIDFSPPSN